MYAVINPVDNTVVEEFPTIGDDELRAVIARAGAEFTSWRTRPIAERATIMHRVADLFEERREELAAIITLEMGKRIAEARGEVGAFVDITRYYADHAEEFLADEPLAIEGGSAHIQKDALGVILGIMPWNYPYYQVARFAAPNLMLGNTVLLKHAPQCPRSSAAIEQIMRDAGVPEGAYTNIYATNEQIEWVIADPRVQGVSLTGSVRAGRAVAAIAGAHLKKAVLELGGSDPMIVLDDVDLEQTLDIAAGSRLSNSGQACNAPKRMIVLAELYDDFVAGLTSRFSGHTLGDPADEATTLAPLSSRAAAERVVAQVQAAVAQGATLHVGGELVDGPGAFVTPAVLTDIAAENPAYTDEIFGPVAIVVKAADEDDAVRIANDTPYGLGSSVFSADRERARRVGARIEAGMVYVNQAGGSQRDLPFGGIKNSGIGRELGRLGFEEFMNKKAVRH